MLEPSEMFKVLSVDTRVRILDILKDRGPLGTKEIANTLGITPAAVSQNLKILKQAGLLRSERQGFWIPYEINESAMDQCRELLTEVCTCGCRGTGEWARKEIESSPLDSLKQYARKLESELRDVQCRIREVEKG